MRGNALKLCQGRFGLDIRRNFLAENTAREVGESPSHWWHCKVSQTLDSRISFPTEMILCKPETIFGFHLLFSTWKIFA